VLDIRVVIGGGLFEISEVGIKVGDGPVGVRVAHVVVDLCIGIGCMRRKREARGNERV
jgi:hypothetical protein